MKTVSGKVISTKSISLSKAAKVLSNFVAAETGSSQAISSYLRRTSAAFDELVQLHKELKASKMADDKKKKHVMEIANDDGQVKYEQNLEEDQMGSDIVRKKHKKSKDVEREDRSSLVIEEGIRKKRKSRCVDREVQDAVEQRSSKKKKRIIESDR